MPESKAISTYGDGVKWIVGLSGAAVGGTFLHFKDLATQPIFVRLAANIALASFILSIWSGVHYLLWLNAVATHKEGIREIEEDLMPKVKAAGNIGLEKALESRLKDHTDRIERARGAMPKWHRVYTKAFGAGLFISGAILILAIILYKEPAQQPIVKKPIPTNRFVLTYSAIHRTAHGKQAHTFLLDQQTGDLWQMVCSKDRVVFHRVETQR